MGPHLPSTPGVITVWSKQTSLYLPLPLLTEGNPHSLSVTNHLRCNLRLLISVYVIFQDAMTPQTVSFPIGLLPPMQFGGQ